jgi:hypothetical protein
MAEGRKIEDLEDASVIWTGQVNAKNRTATDEVVEEQVKVPGQQMSGTSFVNKNYFPPKN